MTVSVHFVAPGEVQIGDRMWHRESSEYRPVARIIEGKVTWRFRDADDNLIGTVGWWQLAKVQRGVGEGF